MISIIIPAEGEKATAETFRWKLDWERIREARANDEGTYLLRTNLDECDPKTLWKRYMIQGEIEYAFRELKNDLGLRPVYHRLDDRILLNQLGLTLPAQKRGLSFRTWKVGLSEPGKSSCPSTGYSRLREMPSPLNCRF